MKSEFDNSEKIQADCRRYSLHLNEYVDGRLNGKDILAVSGHVAVCADCAKVVQQLSSLARLLGSSTKYQVDAEFATSLRARVNGIEQKKHRAAFGAVWIRLFVAISGGRGFTLRLAAPVAGLAAVMVFALFAFHQFGSVPTSVPGVSAPILAPTGTISDSALVQTCVNQHRTISTADPLSDTSAQLLASSVDSLPVDNSKTENLSDNDAAVLLDQEM